MSFSPNSVLYFRFKFSKYCSIHPRGTSCGRLKVETRYRLDFDEDPALFAGNKNPIFEIASKGMLLEPEQRAHSPWVLPAAVLRTPRG